MKLAIVTLAVLVAALTTGCPNPPVPPPPPDATDATAGDDSPAPPPAPAADAAPLPEEASPPPQDAAPGPTGPCADACAALAAAGCAEGTAPTCVKRLQAISDGRLNPNRANGNLPLTCDDLAKVKTPADVKATGQKCTPLPARPAHAGNEEMIRAVEAWADLDGSRPNGPWSDAMRRHDVAARDMARLMNAGF